MDLNRYNPLKGLHTTVLLAVAAATSASGQGSPSSSLNSPTVGQAQSDTYTPQQVRNFNKVLGESPNALFISAMDIVGKNDEEDALRTAIRDSANSMKWPQEKAENFLKVLDQKVPGTDMTNMEVALVKLRLAYNGAPSAAAFTGDYSGQKPSEPNFCIVAMPSDNSDVWRVDNQLFEAMTKLKKPERPFPAPEKNHAFILKHEKDHCDDKTTAVTAQKDLQADFDIDAIPVDIASGLLQLEITADRGAMSSHMRVYHDPEYFLAVQHMRGMASIYDPVHATQSGLGHGKSLAPEKILAGQKIVADYLNKECANDARNCPTTYIDLEPSVIAATLMQALKLGKITNPDGKAVAQEYIKGYAYFEPTKAAEISKALDAEDASKKHGGANKLHKILHAAKL